MSIEDAVSNAVYSHNLQINRRGFSPNQLVSGKQNDVPGISESTPTSLEPVVESDTFRKEFLNRQKAEETYRQIDSNERIQQLMSSQISAYVDSHFDEGNSVYFKED